MWVRKHQGGNDWAGSAFSGPPWSFHESLLSGTLPGRGAMALLFYRFLDLTHSTEPFKHVSLHVPRNLPERAVASRGNHIPPRLLSEISLQPDATAGWSSQSPGDSSKASPAAQCQGKTRPHARMRLSSIPALGAE